MSNSQEKVLTALVTGASAGIGREFARQLHAQNYNLLLIARRESLLAELKQELEQARPNSVELIACDLTLPTSPEFAEVLEYIKTRPIDLLVNNAGRGSFGYFEELDLRTELALVELNISATLRLVHAIIPQMKQRRSGAIISISSVAGFQPLPLMATYAATKAFNLQHTIGLWSELRDYNVKVMAVCPGPVATEFGGVARVPGTVTGVKRDSAEAVVCKALNDLQCGRLISISGLRAKLMVLATQILPIKFTTGILGRQLKDVLIRSKSNF